MVPPTAEAVPAPSATPLQLALLLTMAEATSKAGSVMVEIRDQGPGISYQDQKVIFQEPHSCQKWSQEATVITQ